MDMHEAIFESWPRFYAILQMSANTNADRPSVIEGMAQMSGRPNVEVPASEASAIFDKNIKCGLPHFINKSDRHTVQKAQVFTAHQILKHAASIALVRYHRISVMRRCA